MRGLAVSSGYPTPTSVFADAENSVGNRWGSSVIRPESLLRKRLSLRVVGWFRFSSDYHRTGDRYMFSIAIYWLSLWQGST